MGGNVDRLRLPRPGRTVMLERFDARDVAFNGVFVAAVVTTGIYCLPSCSARKPLRENVRFFDGENDAVEAGFRPCRRCRPDAFYRDHDPQLEASDALFEAMRTNPADHRLAEFAQDSGSVGRGSLQRWFRLHYQSTPAVTLRRIRIEKTQSSLLSTRDPIADIAFAAGFESLSAFHESFRRLSGMTPGAYRRLRDAREFAIQLPYGYPASILFQLAGRDPENPAELLVGNELLKSLELDGEPATLKVTLKNTMLHCRLQDGPPASISAAHRAVIRMTNLYGDPSGFDRAMARTATGRRLIQGRPKLRIPQSANVFEGLTWAIVGQQVNLAFAAKLRRVVIELCDVRTREGSLAHPSAAAVARLDYADLTQRQFSRSKAEYLIDTARMISSGSLDVERLPSMSFTLARKTLLNIRGIGPWSANYLLMRACGFNDCLPTGDTGLVAGLRELYQLGHRPGVTEQESLMARFAPYRSLATMHLWLRNTRWSD